MFGHIGGWMPRRQTIRREGERLDVVRRALLTPRLAHRPPVDAEPPARLVMAQTLVDNRQSNRRIELHAVHPAPLNTTDKGP